MNCEIIYRGDDNVIKHTAKKKKSAKKKGKGCQSSPNPFTLTFYTRVKKIALGSSLYKINSSKFPTKPPTFDNGVLVCAFHLI